MELKCKIANNWDDQSRSNCIVLLLLTGAGADNCLRVTSGSLCPINSPVRGSTEGKKGNY